MYYSRKKSVEERPSEETPVWICQKDGCNGWMRNNFALEAEPVCPLCQSQMTSGVKTLPILNPSNYGYKA
ncbi:cold-shock protein [Gorillibacterium sp. sgz5001074]|uniref:cold-shock protein n=1 Tax=Gorillibacterium sp. sgz5001074 TaxID=3446695 RepID=UPI003F666C05